MSYKEKPLLKIYKYENSAFILKAIIDDYSSCSFTRNKYTASEFSVEINYNIPNSQVFEKNLFIVFGEDNKDVGIITDIIDSIGSDGKGSQIRSISGFDARYIFKRRIISNLNNNENWSLTASGETCMRELIQAQCGIYAEEKRKLPIVNGQSSNLGNQYTVAEAYSNLLDVLETIAVQSEVGWGVRFNGYLELYFYLGEDLSNNVHFSTDFDSLADGTFEDSLKNYCNSVYIGGKGNGSERDIYLSETENIPEGLDRFEAWENASNLTTEEEYAAEGLSMLSQYGQTISMSGRGLAKCPYEYKKQYDVGDIITVGFSGKSAKVQILSVTENWQWGTYNIDFEFGKPVIDLSKQLQTIINQIQINSSETQSKSTDSVKYYTIPSETEMPKGDVTYNTIGFKGDIGSSNKTFKLYFDDEKTGAKTYHIYFKQLTGTGKLILTTGKAGAETLSFSGGTYVAIIYVDENGNVKLTASMNDGITSNVSSWSSEKTNNEISTAVVSIGQELTKKLPFKSLSTVDLGNLTVSPNNVRTFYDKIGEGINYFTGYSWGQGLNFSNAQNQYNFPGATVICLHPYLTLIYAPYYREKTSYSTTWTLVQKPTMWICGLGTSGSLSSFNLTKIY